MQHDRSEALFERALKVQPGGNTRHMVVFGPPMVYGSHGEGCRLTDVDGNVYIDWVNNFSTLIHGYGHRPTIEAIKAQAGRMLCCILPSEPEVELAERICGRWPGAEQVRFMNSGTEAVMVAIKGARALTGRHKIAKSEGGYHGQYDLVEASFLPTPDNWGPPDRPAAPPFAKGTPPSLLEQAVIFPFNDLAATLQILEESAGELAAVVIDPIPARLGFTAADQEYLQAIRDFCTRNGTVLIFDEVFCGRASFGGAQGRLGVLPDMTALGKIIGGGLPIGAVAGTQAAMAVFDNLAGPLRASHSGTFTANPMSMVAGVAALDALTPEAFNDLERCGDLLRSGLTAAFEARGLAMRANGLASMTSLQFFREPARNYREFHNRSGAGYLDRMKSLHLLMLEAGVLMATRGLMVGSTAMTDADVAETVERASRALDRFTELEKAAA
jgi:glutamate-1-semialdehyde 2,1-aminomutase